VKGREEWLKTALLQW